MDRGDREVGSPSGSPVLLQGQRPVKKRKTVSRPVADGGVMVKIAATHSRKGKRPLWMPATVRECIRRPIHRPHHGHPTAYRIKPSATLGLKALAHDFFIDPGRDLQTCIGWYPSSRQQPVIQVRGQSLAGLDKMAMVGVLHAAGLAMCGTRHHVNAHGNKA
jgi:hypothetical protein